MPKLAQFDSTQTAITPVIGWYDTDEFDYPNLPTAANLYECTDAEWAERTAGSWGINPMAATKALLAYTPPAPPPPTLAQQAAVALNGTVAVTSTAEASTLNGTYPIGPQAQFLIVSEMQSITTNGTFADGTTTLEWMDAAGAQHAFSIAEFKSFATAVGAYCSTLYRIAGGTTGLALPSPALTIS